MWDAKNVKTRIICLIAVKQFVRIGNFYHLDRKGEIMKESVKSRGYEISAQRATCTFALTLFMFVLITRKYNILWSYLWYRQVYLINVCISEGVTKTEERCVSYGEEIGTRVSIDKKLMISPLLVETFQCGAIVFYHPQMRVGNVFGRVCLSVCPSVCPSVCLSVHLSVQTITFEPLHIGTSFLVWRYILTISRSSLSIKVIGSRSGSCAKKWLFTYFNLLFLCMYL